MRSEGCVRGWRGGLLVAALAMNPLIARAADEGGAPAAPASDPAPGESASAAASAAMAPTLTGAVAVRQEDGTTRVVLSFTGNAEFSTFLLSNPQRLVVDVPNGAVAPDAVNTSDGLVSKITTARVEEDGGLLRVTLFLSARATFEAKPEGGRIVVTLRSGQTDDPLAEGARGDVDGNGIRLSEPQQVIPGPVLTSLDYQQRERMGVVVLGLKDVEAVVSMPSSRQIVVDLPGATIASSLHRQLDTRFFASAVDEIRAYTTRSGTRLMITLRAETTYEVRKDGRLTLIEIATPQEIIDARERARQQGGGIAPSDPDSNGTGRLEGSYIRPDGSQVDENAAFGRSGGLSSPGSYSFATSSIPSTQQSFTGRRINIDLQDADIHTVFRFLAEYGDVNIVASDDVKGKVTVRLVDVPWDEALAAVLQSKGLGAQQFGNIIRVAPLETIKAEEQNRLEEQKARQEREDLGIYVAPLNYAQADELVEQIESLLSERGSVEVDARGNQLIIRDRESILATVRSVLSRVDTPNRQIIIETRFVEANSSFTQALGIQWGMGLDASAATGFPTGLFFPNSVGVSGSQGSFTGANGGAADNLLFDMGVQSQSALSLSFGSISGLIDVDARLMAAETEGVGRITSTPRVRVMDNETARVEQGTRIPYLSVSNGGTQVQFVQASLQLEVTPHITAEGTIFLDISIQNDRPDFGQAVQGQPAIQTKQVETRVLVADGDTAVLGGVFSSEESKAMARVPGLGKIPLLGYLFRNSAVSQRQNEMLVFITPRIVPADATDGGGK